MMAHLAASRRSEVPLFSIITVVRDDRAGLVRTHESLGSQTFRDFTWIVVDGDSRDGTRDYLSAHRRDLYWWRSAPDRGLYDAMNIGLSAAHGDYVLFLNAGDRLAEPDTLARVAAELGAGSRPDLLYGDALEPAIAGGFVSKPARSHRFAWYGMFTHHQAMFYRHAAIAGLRYDLAYPIGADYAFTLDLLRHPCRAVRFRGAVAVCEPGGQSRLHPAKGRRDQNEIRKARLSLPAVVRWTISGAQWLAMSVRLRWPDRFERWRFRRYEGNRGAKRPR
jgi:putative colanic acid biosynthesis glycosyltransferase